MGETWRYRGQEIGSEQIVFLREFIAAHPTSSRWKLSRQLCEALGWKQANGALRDVVCRGLLLMLERAGQIELPPVRRHIRGQCRTGRPRPGVVLIDTTPLALSLPALGPIDLQPVRRTADEPLFNSLMEHYHYLGYEQPVGDRKPKRAIPSFRYVPRHAIRCGHGVFVNNPIRGDASDPVAGRLGKPKRAIRS
jgi:hypothetical protein